MVAIILRATRPFGGSLSKIVAREVARLAKCLTDLQAGDEVPPGPQSPCLQGPYSIPCGVRQAELYVCCVRHESIHLTET